MFWLLDHLLGLVHDPKRRGGRPSPDSKSDVASDAIKSGQVSSFKDEAAVSPIAAVPENILDTGESSKNERDDVLDKSQEIVGRFLWFQSPLKGYTGELDAKARDHPFLVVDCKTLDGTGKVLLGVCMVGSYPSCTA
jgi:hypothetical protein